jgi:hypothetical protein
MIMADILEWFLIIAGIFLALNAHWLSAQALFPRLVERCRDGYGQRPVGATLLGLAIIIPAVVAAAVLAKTLPHPLIVILIGGGLVALVLLGLLGSAGLAARIGAGLPAPGDGAQPWKTVLRGGGVLGLLFITPLPGWILLLWSLVSGLGMAVLALRAAARRQGAPAASPAAGAAAPTAKEPPSALLEHASSDTVATVVHRP